MKIIAPNYYSQFKCIADKCNHSCCIGWEIDIDNETLEKYNKINNVFGERLKANIVKSDECSWFKLTESERCPFLNENNLCDIILEFGENYLSQICTDHPRFRNFFENKTEIGLGLCCEEACRLILNRASPFELVIIDDDNEFCEDLEDEEEFFKIRQIVFDILRDREFSVDERIENLKDFFNFETSDKTISQWCDILLSLEILNSNWTELLSKLKHSNNSPLPKEFGLWGENLICYFVYRHFTNVLYDGNIQGWLSFAILGYEIIKALTMMNCNDFEDVVEYARLYSSEIEYSQENIDSLIETL